MKKDKAPVCPGCSRHCPMGAPRCKYGVRYFAQLEEKTEKKAAAPAHKWEKLVARDGLGWQVLSAGCAVKKTLRRGEATEEQIFAVLTPEEKTVLIEILKKLEIRGDMRYNNK